MRADEFAEVDEFVGAELIWIVSVAGGSRCEFTAVPEIGAARTFVGRADAVAPVVAVGETPTGKADDGRLDLAHLFDERLADSIDIGNFGIFADPHAVTSLADFSSCAVAMKTRTPKVILSRPLDFARVASGKQKPTECAIVCIPFFP